LGLAVRYSAYDELFIIHNYKDNRIFLSVLLFFNFSKSFELIFCLISQILQPGLNGALFAATEGSGKKAGVEDGKAAKKQENYCNSAK